ncbi:MAG TPA: Hsp20 family protein [Novosphingobium sp.]|nr:Hsp20 family protein [Novosphingobium sp.]
MRTNIDLSPFRRSTVGFDRLFDILDSATRYETGDYPPYNLVREGDDTYRIELALAGFDPDEVEIVAQQNQLTVSGKPAEREHGEYLHRGIATRAFERRFQLADFVEVASARFDNGLLSIALKRAVPEAMKPRKIEIAASDKAQTEIEAPKAREPEAV